jgi:hypothetical protein
MLLGALGIYTKPQSVYPREMNLPEPGTVFGKMTFIGPAGESHKARRWKLLCHCGKEASLKPSEVVKGKWTTCGCRLKHLIGGDSSMSTFIKKLITNYTKSSRVRCLKWELGDPLALELFYSPCHFCGDAPSRILKSSRGRLAPKMVSGIDRMNNSEGYVIGNVLACCVRCNYAKHDMGYEDYVKLIAKTHANLKL